MVAGESSQLGYVAEGPSRYLRVHVVVVVHMDFCKDGAPTRTVTREGAAATEGEAVGFRGAA